MNNAWMCAECGARVPADEIEWCNDCEQSVCPECRVRLKTVRVRDVVTGEESVRRVDQCVRCAGLAEEAA